MTKLIGPFADHFVDASARDIEMLKSDLKIICCEYVT